MRHNIGFVFQDPSSDEILTGRENLYLHALMYGVEMKEVNKRMDEVLKLVDLNRQTAHSDEALFRRHEEAGWSLQGACCTSPRYSSSTSLHWGWIRRQGSTYGAT